MTRYPCAKALEGFLGDPQQPENELSFAKIVQLDEDEAYPEVFCERLTEWKLHHYYVPSEWGGKLTSYEELLVLLRVVSRRDIAAAWSHGVNTFVGAANVWITGSAVQKLDLAQIILAGQQVAAAYNEREHGSDLLSAEVAASPTEDGFLLNGTKWLVGNATRSKVVTVFARTSSGATERDFSLFAVNKDELPRATYSCLPKVKLHGIRGSDVSGIRFANSPVKKEAIIGPLGGALESTMRSFQITRTLVPGLSLGAGDSALRIAMQCAMARRPARLVKWSPADEQLQDAFLDLLVCDCLAMAGARGLHVVPEQMSVWSAVVKYFVPATIEKMLDRLSEVLEARTFLRGEPGSGAFQKIWRDHAVTGFGHTPTYLNLSTIIQNLPKIFAHGRMSSARTAEDAGEVRLRSVFDLDRPLPPFDGGRLALFNRGREDVTQGLQTASDKLASAHVWSTSDGTARPDMQRRIAELARLLCSELRALEIAAAEVLRSMGQQFSRSAEAFELAKRFCIIFAGSSCIHMWMHSTGLLGDFFAEGQWLEECLAKLLGQLSPSRQVSPRVYPSAVSTELRRRFREGQIFSIASL